MFNFLMRFLCKKNKFIFSDYNNIRHKNVESDTKQCVQEKKEPGHKNTMLFKTIPLATTFTFVTVITHPRPKNGVLKL